MSIDTEHLYLVIVHSFMAVQVADIVVPHTAADMIVGDSATGAPPVDSAEPSRPDSTDTDAADIDTMPIYDASSKSTLIPDNVNAPPPAPATPIDMQQGSSLARLPAEILTRITRWLTTPEYSAVRRTCKMVERKTFSQWSHEFFRKKQFMISSFSLNALIEIAEHPELKFVLRHLIIASDTIEVNSHHLLSRTDAQIKARVAAGEDQHFLLATGNWITKLGTAMKLLPNLTTIDIRNFNSRTRFRDGPNAAWKSYGMPTLQATTGFSPEFPAGHPQHYDRLLNGVLLAIGASGVQPPNLEVIVRGAGVSDVGLFIPETLRAKLQPFFQNLRKFHVDVVDSGTRLCTDHRNLKKFISYLPNLTWLRVNMHNYMIGTAGPEASFWEWLGRDPSDVRAVCCKQIRC